MSLAKSQRSNSTVLSAKDVKKSFGTTPVLKGINLEVSQGETVVILGPSGSGKSTFLRCINLLERPDAGRILVNGQDVGFSVKNNRLKELSASALAKRRADIGMVFQQFNLFTHMTVMQNLIEGPTGVRGESRSTATTRAIELLELVGMEGRGDAYPEQLSGGQQQRVAIARALAMNPALVLFDEPTSALDPELVGEVLATMRKLAARGLTMVVVTHEISFAREAADRVVFIDKGVIVEQGSPKKVLDSPEHSRTREFLARFLD